MIINVKDNRIPLARFLDIYYGDLFIYDGSVHIKTSGFSGFRVDNGPTENFYNSIDINGNFCYFTPETLINPIKKITLTIEE